MKSSRKRLLKKIFANVTVGLFIVAFFGNSIAGQFSGQINSFLGTSTTQIVGEDAGEYVRYYESEFGSIAELKAAEMIVVEGTLYPLLTRQKNQGLLSYRWEESPQGPPRKYYSITQKGRECLEQLDIAWSELISQIRIIRDGNR